MGFFEIPSSLTLTLSPSASVAVSPFAPKTVALPLLTSTFPPFAPELAARLEPFSTFTDVPSSSFTETPFEDAVLST